MPFTRWAALRNLNYELDRVLLDKLISNRLMQLLIKHGLPTSLTSSLQVLIFFINYNSDQIGSPKKLDIVLLIWIVRKGEKRKSIFL